MNVTSVFSEFLHVVIAIFLVLHGDSPPRVGDTPPSLPAPRGIEGSHTPPLDIGGLLDALHDFPNFSFKKTKF